MVMAGARVAKSFFTEIQIRVEVLAWFRLDLLAIQSELVELFFSFH